MSDRADRLRASVEDRLGIEIRESQWIAGERLSSRCVVEMATGEGKTLASVIAAASLARKHQQVLVATANDYLADRDSKWMGDVYSDLDISLGCVTANSSEDERSQAYAADVVYGTIREFAFDYLRHARRHRELRSSRSPTIRFQALILDEADSVLIDEARTPLAISGRGEPRAETSDEAIDHCLVWAASLANDFCCPDDFIVQHANGLVALTASGRQRVLRSPMPQSMNPLTTTEILNSMEQAIWVKRNIHRNRHYIVKGTSIHLVDESTGRPSPQRKYTESVQQAIEANEGLPLSKPSRPLAKITVQEFVGQFDHVCGLTATAWEDRRELNRIYRLDVHRVAQDASTCQMLSPAVFATRAHKWEAMAQETADMVSRGRPVLVGVPSVEQCDQLSQRFDQLGIEHAMLSAKHHEQEAIVISSAGLAGQVTIATNMAGRGTDIRLGRGVAENGGMHVIVSQPHSASRLDRQLIGRSARQGDPGSARIFASAEDEILSLAYGLNQAERIAAKMLVHFHPRRLWSRIQRAQRIVARKHRLQRDTMTEYQSRQSEALRQIGLDPHLDPIQ